MGNLILRVKEKAEDFSNQMGVRTFKRDNGEEFKRTVCKDNASEELHILVREAHGDMFPDDFKYQIIGACLEFISNSEAKDLDELQEDLRTWTDSEVDIYTYNLTAWLHSNINRVYYLSDALQEFEPKDGFQVLSIAQYMEIEEIADSVFSSLIKLCEEEEEDNA